MGSHRMTALAAALAAVLVLAGTGAARASGGSCTACVLVIGLLSQRLQTLEGVDARRDALHGAVHSACSEAQAETESCKAAVHGSGIGAALTELASLRAPEEVCQSLKMCDGTCTLFKSWPVDPPHMSTYMPKPLPGSGLLGRSAGAPAGAKDGAQGVRQLLSALTVLFAREVASGPMRSVLDLLGVQRHSAAAPAAEDAGGFYDTVSSATRSAANPCGLSLSCDIDRVFDKHLPFKDGDGDNFSGTGPLTAHLRGRDWRGTDCDDSDANVYPGRREPQAGATADEDHNCNGVFGVSEPGSRSYEDLYCNGTEGRGVLILGDSATAHFHIPPEWLLAREFPGSFLDIVSVVEDEADWPQCSWSTGHESTDKCPPSAIPMGSIYQRMRARNLCNNNDFQNIGVNGARTSSMDTIMYGVSRDQKNDNPALVFYALIGNDVCNGHPGSSHWTPVDEFKTNVLKSLAYLDTVLPAGSHVVFIGLADGRVLWDNMHALTHPIGVPYADVYEFLSCNGNNPCWGWLNANETWRNATSAHARSLSAVYTQIIEEKAGEYKNFKMIYHDPDWDSYVRTYVAAGGRARDLIEPVDGFHPSQTGNQMMAKAVWEFLEQSYPEALGDVNPHNADIARVFGL